MNKKLLLAICRRSGYNGLNYTILHDQWRKKETEAHMAKIIKWVVIELIIFAVFITGSVILVTRFIQPYMDAQTNMPSSGSFIFRQMESGQLEITWPAADQADYYIFQVYQLPNGGQLSYQNNAGELVYEKKVTDGNTVVIPSDAYTGNMLFKVSAARGYEIRQTQQIRISDNALELVTKFDAPAIENVTCTTDADKQVAYFRFELTDATSCHVSLVDASGEKKFLKTVNGNAATVTFGEEGDLPMPGFGEKVDLHFDVTRETEQISYYSTDFATFSVERSMLVPSDILLECTYDGDDCWLNWEAEECDYYEVQYLDTASGKWEVLGTFAEDEGNSCNLSGSPEELTVVRVAAAYEKETKDENGQPVTTVKYRSISNEIGVLPLSQRPQPEKTRIPVAVTWDDADDKDGIRPDGVVVQLFADDKAVSQITLSEENGWSGVFEDLPIYDKGQRIKYTVTMDAGDGYTVDVTGTQEEGFTLNGFHEPRPDTWIGAVTINNLRIRSGAGYNYSIVGYLQKGDRIEILEIVQVGTDLWGRIENGWVAMEFVVLDGVRQTVTVLINNLRIRADTGFNYNILGYLQKGDKVEILETKLVGDVLWGRIEQGWISLDEEYVAVDEVMP